jgi:hypothetical protein
MKNLILILFLVLSVHKAKATIIEGLNINQGVVNLVFSKVEIGDLETLMLTNHNNIEMEFDCKANTFNRIGNNYLRYKNYYNRIVDDFFLDDQSCNYIKKFLVLTFEAISEEYPVKMVLDVQSKKIARVILPPLDPYWDGGEIEKKKLNSVEVLSQQM